MTTKNWWWWVGYIRKVAESFTNMKARTEMNRLQTIYLQCEDFHCKARSKMTQEGRGGGDSWHLRKVLPKLRKEL